MNDLAAFSAVAGQRSFRKAADQLGVSRSALSHTLNGLERNLGVRLLHRTTRSVSPTEAGSRLLERLDPVLQDLDAALDGLTETGAAPAGPLRLNANKSGARWLLRRVVPAFRARYPGVDLDLISEGRLIDIVEGGFDAGVRLAEAVPRDMIAVPVAGEVRFVAITSPGYMESRPPVMVPDDLARHACIRQRLPSGRRYRWEFSHRGESIAVDVSGALTLDDNDLMVQAAVDGLGIAYVPESFAREKLRSGELVTVLDEWCPPVPGLMLYYPGRRHVPATLRAFIGVLKEANRDAADS